jgi:hypothetical protein
MNLNTKITLGAVLMLTVGCASAMDLKIGDRLPLTQVKSLTQQVLTVGKSTLRIVGVSADGTMVANELGAVGLSRNEVLISQVPTAQVRKSIDSIAGSASSVTYYEPTQITVLRFATLAQAVQARSQILALLPKAGVSVPVDFAQPTLK